MNRLTHWFVILIFSLMLQPAFAKHGLEQRLKKFQANPKEFLNTIPEKVTVKGTPYATIFSEAQGRDRSFIAAKNSQRDVLTGRSATKTNDRADALVDAGKSLMSSLKEMEEKNLLRGEVAVQPWSDYYWALFNGQIAYRFADAKFPFKTEDWKIKSDFLMDEASQSASVDSLSPAEKYDLLVGDERKSLTRAALAEGEQFYRQNNKVETWMGICHGWAPAAFMLDRPTGAASMMAADGKTMINFYPSDIKALSSLLWAKSAPDTRFIGGRCNTKDPKTDANGRVKDQNCFDTNPGTWHQAMVNQIGVSKRSFVMDATFDYEVWNQPLKGYAYTYFNPQTMAPVKSLKDAMVDITKFKDDKFAKHRSKKTRQIVGISMDVDYIVETFPVASKTDSAEKDAVKQVTYEYDLELDDNMKIIGGEWYSNAHPDFLWVPAPGAKATTSADELLAGSGADKKIWNKLQPIPREWQEMAPRASSYGTPMSTIVEQLIQISRSSRQF